MSVALKVAVLTVSATRTQETDTSGAFLEEALREAVASGDLARIQAAVREHAKSLEGSAVLTEARRLRDVLRAQEQAQAQQRRKQWIPAG